MKNFLNQISIISKENNIDNDLLVNYLSSLNVLMKHKINPFCEDFTFSKNQIDEIVKDYSQYLLDDYDLFLSAQEKIFNEKFKGKFFITDKQKPSTEDVELNSYTKHKISFVRFDWFSYSVNGEWYKNFNKFYPSIILNEVVKANLVIIDTEGNKFDFSECRIFIQ